MKTYTYTVAQQRLEALLDLTRREGRVQIRRRDGQLFVVKPATPEGSPLDVPGVRVRLRRGEPKEWLAESREQAASRILPRRLSNKRTQQSRARRKPAGTKRRKPKSRPRR